MIYTNVPTQNELFSSIYKGTEKEKKGKCNKSNVLNRGAQINLHRVQIMHHTHTSHNTVIIM